MGIPFYCRQAVTVCGYREGMQDNWLMTQYIRRLVTFGPRLVRLSSISVLLEIELPSETPGDRHVFTSYVYEAPTDNSILAARPNNYRLATTEDITGLSGMIKKTFHFNFTSNHDGFYIAIRDRTTCFTIRRFIVYYSVCNKETRDFAMFSGVISPKIVPDVECVEGASPENGVKATFECLRTGNWSPLPGAGCQCDSGTIASKDRRSCIQDLNCPAGEYFYEPNAECRACPGNSESTVSGLTVCPCVDGYYRAEGEEDRECTRKYVILEKILCL